MKSAITLLSLMLSVTSYAQTAKGYEIERDMPSFLNGIKAELTYPMAWGNSPIKEFDMWRTMARACVYDAMLTPPPFTSDYKTVITATEQRGKYRAEKIQFNLSGFSRVNAYVLTPNGKGPFPAIVVLHDHGGHYTIGKEKMIRPFNVSDTIMQDADQWVANLYDGQYLGDYLAAHGYVVICTDAIFWGERGRKEGVDGDKHMAMAGNFMMLGRDWSGFMNYEDIYTTDYLATLPQVDSSRIGCIGMSMGGYRSWMLAAMSDKIKAAVAVCWMVTTGCQLSWEHGNEHGGFANTLPALRQYMDYPHIASLACPRPVYFINGTQDKLFHPDGVKGAFATMHKVWQSQGADDKLKTELWNIPHHCGLKVQQASLAFLDKYLK